MNSHLFPKRIKLSLSDENEQLKKEVKQILSSRAINIESLKSENERLNKRFLI